MKQAVNPGGPEPVRCPNCLSIDVRYSKRRLWDSLLEMLLHWEVFRCRNCRHRFHQYFPDES